jgi:hypothetical protein
MIRLSDLLAAITGERADSLPYTGAAGSETDIER